MAWQLHQTHLIRSHRLRCIRVPSVHECDLFTQVEGTLCPQCPLCSSTMQELWEEKLLEKTEAEKLSTSATFLSIVTGFPVVCIWGWCGDTHSLTFFFWHTYRNPYNSSYLLPSSASAVIWPFWPLRTQVSNTPILFPGYLSLLPLSESVFIDLVGIVWLHFFEWIYCSGVLVEQTAVRDVCLMCIAMRLCLTSATNSAIILGVWMQSTMQSYNNSFTVTLFFLINWCLCNCTVFLFER